MPYQIIYSSQAAEPMTALGLEKILIDARAGNEARGVTGALIYVDGVFLQIIEGDKDVVQGLMASITKDSRHTRVKVFSEMELSEPTFGSWRMAYLNASPEQMSAWAGLPGTTSIESILENMDSDPQRPGRIARGIIKALAN